VLADRRVQFRCGAMAFGVRHPRVESERLTAGMYDAAQNEANQRRTMIHCTHATAICTTVTGRRSRCLTRVVFRAPHRPRVLGQSGSVRRPRVFRC
jgi:hypothetical protein